MGILENLRCPCLAIECVGDHIHILFVLSKNHALAEVVEEVKRSSSKWIKTQAAMRGFYWQAGYAAFSVSASKIGPVAQYIRNQERHHRKVSYQDELREFFKKHGVAFDERYFGRCALSGLGNTRR